MPLTSTTRSLPRAFFGLLMVLAVLLLLGSGAAHAHGTQPGTTLHAPAATQASVTAPQSPAQGHCLAGLDCAKSVAPLPHAGEMTDLDRFVAVRQAERSAFGWIIGLDPPPPRVPNARDIT